MTQGNITDQDLDELVERCREAAVHFIRGEMHDYLRLIHHSDDYTLMPPTGGETRHGFDDSEESVAATAAFFHGGEADFEVHQTYASGDLAVVVGVERQRGVVGDLPEQDYSLRLTLVFRREGSDWVQVHRHADALAHEISFEKLAALARG